MSKKTEKADLDFLTFGKEFQLFTSDIIGISKEDLTIHMKNGDIWHIDDAKSLSSIFEKKLKYELYCAEHSTSKFETIIDLIEEKAEEKANKVIRPFIERIEENTSKFDGLMKKVVFNYQTFENQISEKSKVIDNFDFKKLENSVEQITKITEEFNTLLS